MTYGDGGSPTRGSVWVEQEIAVAAFISQIVGRELQTAAFVHESLSLEGMRAQLLLNPHGFKNNSEHLDYKVTATLHISGQEPFILVKNMRELQNF